jgi:hypothetical protein
MTQIIFAEPKNSTTRLEDCFTYKDELKEELQNIEDTIKSMIKKHNVMITYNSLKYPDELVCLINENCLKLV